MRLIRNVLPGITVLLCAALAFGDSANTISINGTANYGFALTTGDFQIQGNGLNLFQGLPDGPSTIGSCTVGSVCTFSWQPGPGSAFCSYCIGLSGGAVGSQAAQYLVPNLTFSGSAFYSGGDTLTMQITVSGTITGYQLVGCTAGISCSLGPKEFTLTVSGHGTEQLTLNSDAASNASVSILGARASFSGSAETTTTPEPASVLLVGTGLAGVCAKRKNARKAAN